METLQVWPDGEIELIGRTVGSADYVILKCTNSTTGQPTEIGFRIDHFVALADTFADMAAFIVENRPTPR